MKISTGIIKGKKKKVVIYGVEGVGKSTLAAKFPDPLFIDTEGGTANLNIKRFEGKPTSYEMLKSYIDYVRTNKAAETLVIDTLDWAEQLLIEHVLNTHKKKSIEEFGYGSGYVLAADMMRDFLKLLQGLIDDGICNVVLLCHAQIRKVELPDESGSFDRYELKLGKKTASQTSPLVKEWADMILFCNYGTTVIQTKDGKNKAKGNTRVMYTTHSAVWDAKNRYGLPDKLPLDYSGIKAAVEDGEETKSPDLSDFETLGTDDFDISEPLPESLPKELKDLLTANGVSLKEIQLAVAQKGYFPESTPVTNYPNDFIMGVLVGAWEQVLKIVHNNRNNAIN